MPINLSKSGRRAIHVRRTKFRFGKEILKLACLFSLSAAAVLFFSCLAAAANPLTVVNLRCEYKTNPVGIDSLQPRLSWELVNPQRATVQTAYQIRVAAAQSELEKNDLWDSGKQPSDISIQVAYQGPALSSGKRYYWQVVVWDNHGNSSGWSSPQYWEMGLLQPSDWQAHWITPGLAEDYSKSNPSPMLRHEFHVPKAVSSARLYASAMGLYELHLNGQRVGDEYFTPGWTSYDFRYQYQTFDVTSAIKRGENCLGAVLGDGWFRGYIQEQGKRSSYGSQLALIAQLEITYTDGTHDLLVTDESWKSSTGPILASDIYNGETYDARLEIAGWSQAGYDDNEWKGVTLRDTQNLKLVAPPGPPVRRAEEIKPVKILKTPAGETVIDMGQNMVGWVRFSLNAPAGTTILLRHAEVLDSAGNFYVQNLRTAQQTIRYTTKGGGVETFEPHFTFQGFRYVAVSGWPGDLSLESFVGVVVHSDMVLTGSFSISSPLLNQLQHNIVWSEKGNFLDVPTDCPQRDERLGWTGDTQVFARTAAFNYETAGFYSKWLADLALDQEGDGGVPFVVPNFQRQAPKGQAGAAGWADAAVIVPWTLYLAYGDRRILEQQYGSMKAWVEYMRHAAGDTYLWRGGFDFGDWLALDSPGSNQGATDKDLIKNAYFVHSTDLLQRAALVLRKKEDAAAYADLLGKVKAAFLREFATANGRLTSDTQTAYVLTLAFGIFPESMRKNAATRLVADVRSTGHLTTGFLGTPLLLHVLTDYGYFDEAYMLLNRKEYPSWLYPVTKGATTIWERWDGMKPDGSFQDDRMNSFNHYALGAVGDWMYRVIAGIEIDPQRPGYQHALIQPHPGGGLTWVKVSEHTMFGVLASNWEIKDSTMTLRVEVPANTTATVRLPRAAIAQVKESGLPLVAAKGLAGVRQEEGSVALNVGSGTYSFSFQYKP
jgi:alpha-L-rhamnosidase